MKGKVIKSTGSWYQVRTETGEVLPARIVGKFRLEGQNVTNPIAVGDDVNVELETDAGQEQGIINKIYPRKNYVARQSPRRKQDIHLLASNIDQAVLFVTIVHPNLKQGFIDRFLLTTEPQDIPTIIVVNKADLYSDGDMRVFDFIKNIYEKIGYTVLLTSILQSASLVSLKAVLTDKISLVSGQSGVGKSSVINAIQPALHLRTGELSDYSGKGQHTTTFAEMHALSFGGSIIDTPGIKSLAFNNLEPMDVAHNFREFFALSDNCRFRGSCTHRNEPKCAVKAAIAEGSINELRYANYLQILEEIEDQNYWERHSDEW
ncbi:MAG: ribosome small subunit-dependent GTPase A [Saprospiraceae bacterium]|nr:ribosome small subunit-dependent GTPase A [Saprospiraceae bacterium]MBP7679996.1 ribosome small subunit-dependent GTPase A [Saprospiraceae bacterium]